jgi:hypothetical protein
MITELVMMLAIVLGGIAIARFLKIESIWLAFPAGLIGTMVLRGVSFTLMYPLGMQLASKWVFVALALGLFAWVAWRDRASLLNYLWLPTAMGALAVFATRVVGILHTGHSDSRWILIVVRVMQQGDSLDILSDSNVFKRGLIFPLMTAMGATKEFLTSLTPYSYAALISLGVALLQLLLKGYSKRAIWYSVVPMLAVLFSTTMWWRAIFYVNSHLFMGILIATVLVVSLMAIRRGSLLNTEFALLLMSSYSFGMVRSEGILISLMVLLPLFSQHWLKRTQLIALLIAPAVSLTAWVTFYDNYILQATRLPWFGFLIVLCLVSVVPALKWFDWLRQRAIGIGIWALVAVLTILSILFPISMFTGWYAQFINLVGTKGLWGYLFVVLAIFFIVGISKHYSLEHKIMLRMSGLLFLAFLASKTLDDAALGKPGLGRIGWADSLNRMWIHIVVILAVTAIASLANKFEPQVAKGREK